MKNRNVIHYYDAVVSSGQYILVADIGGTNSNIGFCIVRDQQCELVVSIHYKSQQVEQFTHIVQDALSYMHDTYNVVVTDACIAAAGVVSRNADFIKPTNLDFTIYKNTLIAETSLNRVLLINDFVVIGYGIQSLSHDKLICINQGIDYADANKAIVGAGTGLGKSVMSWNEHTQRYVPFPSEGGHADFASHTHIDFELLQYISDQEKRSYPISWEDILSGDGIKRMYAYFHQKNGMRESSTSPHPDEIFSQKDRDTSSAMTVELYTTLYARCAKNFALDTLSLNGLYIAGGIAAKNILLFQSELFWNEFISCEKQGALLENIPLYVIADYNVSLYGAATYLLLHLK